MGGCWPVPTTGEGTNSGGFFPISIPTLTSIPRIRQGWGRSIPTPGTVRIWDTQTGIVINDIDIDDFGEIAFSGNQGTITLVVRGNFCTYDGLEGTQLCEGELLQSYNHQLGAYWVHDGSLRFAKSFWAGGQLIIGIHELQPTSTPLLPMVASFPVPPHNGKLSFSPASSHTSFVTETEVVILDVLDSKTLFRTKVACPLYVPEGRFSLDGRLFACGTLKNEIYVWEKASAGYVPWSYLRPQLPFTEFAFSPVATSILSWGPDGIELLYPDNSAGGARTATARREKSVVSRREIVDPGRSSFHFRLPHAHSPTVELLAPDIGLRTRVGGYQHGDWRGCLQGTRGTVLETIESWVKDFNRPPIFWLNGPAGTGKSAIAQTVVEWCDSHGQLVSSFFCSHGANDHGNLDLIFPALAIQLAQKHPRVRSILVSLLRSDPDVVYESPSDQMENLIANPLKSADVPTVIVIDALDEWVDDTLQSAILSAVEYWIEEIPEVKFFVTSRPKPHILASFHLPLLSGLADIFTLHDTAPDLVNNDIRVFLKHELSGLASQNGLDTWPALAQLDMLCDRADGLFVFAVATVKFLGHDYVPPNEQYAVIAHSPDDTAHEGTVDGVHRGLSLDSLCTSILRASFRNNDAQDDAIVRSVLATVVLVTRPLPPSAIADLICLEVEEVESILGSIQSLLRLHEDPDQPVRPLHKLLSDFLTSPNRCVDERFYISPRKFHSEIALSCLKLLNETLDDSPSPQNQPTDSEVALKYACTSRYIHLAQARDDVTDLIPTLRRFLEEKTGAWLEALDTLGALTAVVTARDKTISWLRGVCFGLFYNVP